MKPLWLPLLLVFGMNLGSAGMSAPRLFYLVKEPPALWEYKQDEQETVFLTAVPAEALKETHHLRVDVQGRAVFYDSRKSQFWVWDGNRSFWTTVGRSPFYLSDGAGYLWYENVEEILVDRTEDAPETAIQHFRVYQSEWEGPDSIVFYHQFPPCDCFTGACDETCPTGVIVHPHDTIRDTFLLNHLVLGQLESRVLASFQMNREPGEWKAVQLAGELEVVLDLAVDPTWIVSATRDSGCCGWANDSSDTTLLTAGERIQVLFDEHAMYGNSDYDVSIFTSRAAIAPGRRMVALEVAYFGNHPYSPKEVSAVAEGVEEPEKAFRLSHDGRHSSTELKRIQDICSKLPQVQVVVLKESSVERHDGIDNASLVGWTDPRHLLVYRGEQLFRYDTHLKSLHPIPLTLSDARHAFLRW
jgi:hypothetical protein